MKKSALRGFREAACENPAAAAVIDGTRRVSFEELDQASDGLAARLRAAGACRETVVGILLPKSADYVAAALGVLKTGAAFLPLDPAYPADWLARVCSAARVRHAVSAGRYRSRHDLTGLLSTIILDGDDEADGTSAAAAGGRGGPDDEPHPAQLAYVIFTSGSTGPAKGVGVTHAGLSSLIAWNRTAYEIGPGTVTTSVADISFDASVWEIFGTICSGGTIVLASESERGSPAALAALFERHAVTTAFLPTLMAEHVLAERSWSSLRRLLVGGDALRFAGAGDAGTPEVINHYGPTEAAVVATAGVIECGGDVHIGRPLPHAFAYVLDETFRPVPPGTVGDIFVAGAGVARGYLTSAGATAEVFLPDPLGEPGTRMYRTGDRGLVRPDGCLSFTGRGDGFVKVRGYRVSLREIEAAAESHPQVQAAAAVTLPGPDGGSTIGLCAAIGGAELTGLDLRTYLADLLPGYQVPARFVLSDRLPATSRGKVDRAAIEEAFARSASGSRRPPGTPVEEVLLLIWQQVLGLQDIGMDDDFFDLGGHSILATEVAGLVRDHFDAADVPLEVFYSDPTIAGLAREVELVTAGGNGSEPRP